MSPNPISDVISFLLQPGWTTVVYWLLAYASVAIAASCTVCRPDVLPAVNEA